MRDPWSRLKTQSLARELTADEIAFAQALEEIFTSGVADFDDVARRLADNGVVAPIARHSLWDSALLEAELSAANHSLDQAYARNGIGA